MVHEAGQVERANIRIAPLQVGSQVPAVIPPARSAIEIAKAAVQRATDAFEVVAAGKPLHAEHPVASWASRHSVAIDVLGFAGIGLALLSAGAALWHFEGQYLWGLAPALVSLGACMGLEGEREALKKKIAARVLNSDDVEPIVTALKDSSDEERALVRLFVEQQTSELENAKRLTPAAALALRQSIKGSVRSHDELERVGRVATFVAKHKTVGVTDDDLYALNAVLHAANPDERVAAADYIDTTLFPKEQPLPHLGVEQARKLYTAIAYFRGEDVPAPPVAAAPPAPAA
ncbi:MAG: hypothetical protein ACAI38_24750 [Myxococcota bacterium]|nr:hypothetical protein [Myxococcota bacterium]